MPGRPEVGHGQPLVEKDDGAIGKEDSLERPLGPSRVTPLEHGHAGGVFAVIHPCFVGLLGPEMGGFEGGDQLGVEELDVGVARHYIQGLFLDTWLGTHSSTMLRDIEDIHGERADPVSVDEMVSIFDGLF